MIRVYRHGSVWARFEFKLEDFGIGAFWRREAARWDIWLSHPLFPSSPDLVGRMNLMKPYDDMTEFDKYEMYLRYQRLLFGWEMMLLAMSLFFGGAGIGYLAGSR